MVQHFVEVRFAGTGGLTAGIGQQHYAAVRFTGAGSVTASFGQQHCAAIRFDGAGTLTTDTEHWDRRETRQRAVEWLEKVGPDVALPLSTWTVILSCARAGIGRGQGKGRPRLPQTVKLAREIAWKEAPELLRQYGARAETAEAMRQRMRDLGDDNPPSVETILKRGLS